MPSKGDQSYAPYFEPCSRILVVDLKFVKINPALASNETVRRASKASEVWLENMEEIEERWFCSPSSSPSSTKWYFRGLLDIFLSCESTVCSVKRFLAEAFPLIEHEGRAAWPSCG